MYRKDPMFAGWTPLEFTFGGGWFHPRSANSKIPGNNTCRVFQNLQVGADGRPYGRYGYSSQTIGNNVTITGPVTGIKEFYSSANVSALTFFDKGALRWCDLTNNRVIQTGLTNPGGAYPPSFTMFNDVLIMALDLNAPRQYNGTAGASVGGTPPTSQFCLTHGNRLWLFDATQGYFSADSNQASWDTTNWTEKFGVLDGDVITGVGKAEGGFHVFKTDNIWTISGYPSAGNDITYSKTRSVRGVGCLSPASLVQVGQNWFFFANDGRFHVYSGGANTRPISAPIQDYIQDSAYLSLQSYGALIVGGYLPIANKIVWCFPKVSATVNDRAFVLDLDRGGMWYEWTNFPFDSFGIRSATQHGICFAGTAGTTNKAIVQINGGNPSGDVTDSLPSASTAITVTAQSDYHDAGFPYMQKQTQHLIVEASGTVSVGSPATVTIYTRNGTTETTTTVSITSLPWSNGLNIDGTWERVSVKYTGPQDTILDRIVLFAEPVSARAT